MKARNVCRARMHKIWKHRSQHHYFLKTFEADGWDMRYQKPQSGWILSCKWWATTAPWGHCLFQLTEAVLDTTARGSVLASSAWNTIGVFYCTFQSRFWDRNFQEVPGWLCSSRQTGDGFPLCQQELGSLSALQHSLGCFLFLVSWQRCF